jgi:hypothetical protein
LADALRLDRITDCSKVATRGTELIALATQDLELLEERTGASCVVLQLTFHSLEVLD